MKQTDGFKKVIIYWLTKDNVFNFNKNLFCKNIQNNIYLVVFHFCNVSKFIN